jgi:predicted GNAT family acetyltransferase
MESTVRRTPIGEEERHLLAEALGDTPETAIAVHLLRRGLCCAFIGDEPSEAVIVQNEANPGDVYAFGVSPDAIQELLGSATGWRRVSAPGPVARLLGPAIERQAGLTVNYEATVYHTLKSPVVGYRDTAVRRLSVQDAHLLEAAPQHLQVGAFGDIRALVVDGIVACAIVDGEIVTIAHTSAVTDRHADIGVMTLEPWRGRAFATAAASLVAAEAQRAGLVPVWTTKDDDFASIRIAEKLGFAEVSRRVVVSVAPQGL